MGSRVCDIKKKFEGLSEASKVPPRPDCTPSILNQTKHLNVNLSGRKFSENGSNSSSSRGLIKRSHAFRSDKLTRNHNNSESSGPHIQKAQNIKFLANENDINSSITRNSQVIFLSKLLSSQNPESRHNTTISSSSCDKNKDKNCSSKVEEPNADIIESDNFSQDSPKKTDQNSVKLVSLIKRPDSLQLNNSVAITNDRSVGKRSDSMELDQNNHCEQKLHCNNINAHLKASKNQDKKDEPDDNALSNTLKKVLKSPLPSGPPPKKPPRTFAHFNEKITHHKLTDAKSMKGLSSDDIQIDTGNCDEFEQINKPVRSKTESQIMLKKLEIALLNHKTQGRVIEPKTEKRKILKNEELTNNNTILPGNSVNTNRPIHLSAVRKISLPETPSVDKNTPGNGCFGVLSCSNSVDLLKTHIYDTPFESKSKFYLEDIDRNQPVQDILSKENVFQKDRLHYGKIKASGTQEPIYAKPQVKSHAANNSKCEKKTQGTSVLQIVKSLNENMDRQHIKGDKEGKFKTQPLHYMYRIQDHIEHKSSPVWEKVPLLQSPAPSPPEKGVVAQKKLFENTGARTFPSRSFSIDIEKANTNNSSARSFSVDFSHGDKDFHIDNEKIQKMVNEVYSKCLAMPQDSDSESVASTPDETAPKPIPTKHVSPEEVQKGRQQRTAERKTYLRRVCSRAKSFHRPSVGFPRLFEYLLLIGLDLDPSRCKVPYIKARYPEDAEVPRGIEDLCFPDAADWPPQGCAEDGASRCYCVVITHSSGSRKYGYCRRVQPEGAPICLPLAYCIVSPYKANYYFGEVLAELESRHGQPEQSLSSFIHQLYECPFPPPGQGLLVTNTAGEKVEILPRKLDPRQEEIDIARLLNLVRFSIFLQLFSTLLLERKVILLSYSNSKLSTCIEGLCAALYPFHWQHTLVPIVPSTMLDVCQAPTPYVIGLLKPRDPNAQPPVCFSSIDQVLVVDVDESKVVQSCGDESSVIPPRLCRGLREALHCAIPEKNAALSPAHNLVASEALIALFVQMVGHYRDHIITSSTTGQREFQRDGFVKSVPSNTVQSFLDWFSETTMFTAFIESRLDRSVEPWGLFEQRCVEHLAQQQAVLSKGYRANINKTVKSFGDRFKEWTNSS